MKATDDNGLIGAEEAGRELGMCGRSVRRFAVDGLIPARRIGTVWVFRIGDVRKVRGKLPRPGYPKGRPRKKVTP